MAEEQSKYDTDLRFEIVGRDVRIVGQEKPIGFTIGEGMAMFGHSRGPLWIVNTENGKVRCLLNETGHVVGFEPKDFDLEKIGKWAERYSFRKMEVDYAGMHRYSDYSGGVCCIYWMLHPDGRYFMDSDGFGMEDDEEEAIYCYMDKNLNVVIPFQPMKDLETHNRFAEEARKRIIQVNN